jgi:hypothetical protein
MGQNSILGPNNEAIKANAPSDLQTLRETLAGLPLGITADGEVGLKVIVIGNVSAGIDDLPTEDPLEKGRIWNDGGEPRVSKG